MKYLIVLFVALYCQLQVNLAINDASDILSPTIHQNLQCGNFTYDKCTLDLAGLITSLDNITPEQCQFFCNTIYQGVCKFFHFENKKQECSLLVQSIEEHIRTCDQRAGPTEPNVDDCFADSNPCNFFHEEGCIYHGNEIGYFPTLASISLCQLACANTPQCVHFLYDFDIKDCQLFDSGDRDCDFLVGPANPTYEECKEEITTTITTTTVTTTTTTTVATTTTTTTVTTTTTTPSQCTSHTYHKSDGTCACAFGLERGLTWQQAAEQCYSYGARLPEIYSAEDNIEIFNLKPLDTGVFADGLWLGATDIQTEGTFIWEFSGLPVTYTNWSPGQPDEPGEDCMHMWTDIGEWNNFVCDPIDVPQAAICEKIVSCV